MLGWALCFRVEVDAVHYLSVHRSFGHGFLFDKAGKLRDEINLPVEMLVGSTFAKKADNDHQNMKLLEVRSAKIIVATAGAFEHAMCKVRESGGRDKGRDTRRRMEEWEVMYCKR